jgi:putative MFS transporter
MNNDNLDAMDAGRRIDAQPVTALHLTVVGLCTIGFAFDLFEMALGSVLGAVFSMPGKQLPAAQLSWLLASVYIGAIAGAPLLGWLADRFGRRQVLSASLVWLAGASAWAAFSADMLHLTLARMTAGIALGAYPPLMVSYLTDILPSSRRGPITLWACGLGALGLPVGVFFVRSLGGLEPLGLEPWRWAFLLGTFGAGVVGLLMLRLPESPRWLQSRGRTAEAQQACDLFARSRPVLPARPADPPVIHVTARGSGSERSTRSWLFALFFLSPFATVAFPLLMGTVLAARGFQLSDALLFVGLSNLGPTLGSLASSLVVDRVDRRLALVLCASTMLVSGTTFVVTDSRGWLGAAAILFGIAAILYTTAMSLYASELFPTRSRAAGSASAWAFNRLGAALGLLVMLPLLKQHGPLTMFAVIVGSLTLGMLLLTASPRGLQRQAVA